MLVTAMQVFGQMVDDADETGADDPVAEKLGDTLGLDTGKEDRGFELLVRAMAMRGEAEVLNPDVGVPAPVVKNKAYPLGSTFRTGKGASLNVAFSASEQIELLENTEVVVLAGKQDPKTRSVRLVSGRIKTFLKDTLLDGQFSVETANVSCKNMAGRARFSLAMEGENENFEAATIRGSIRVEGLQYTIESLGAANIVNVLTTPNRALSRLTGVSGDYKIKLDNGTDDPVIFDMTPKAVVKIMRDVAPVGGRLIVSTLAMGPTGKARHHFTYAVGRGDIVVAGGQTDMDDQDLTNLLRGEDPDQTPQQPPDVKPDAPPTPTDADEDI